MNFYGLDSKVKSAENIFIKISDKEKESLLPLLVLLEQKIHFKCPGSNVFETTVFDINRLGHLVAKKPVENLAMLKFLEDPLISFEIDQERYFAKFKIKILSQNLIFDTSGDLFILKRRKFRRLKLPETYPARAIVKEVNGRRVFIECRVLDVSARGARIQLPMQLPRLKPQSRLRINLSFGNRTTLDLLCLVRHHRQVSVQKMDQQIFGVEFLDLDKHSETRLFKYLGEMETEVFGRFVQK